jgi:hypothetical protein
MAEAMSSQQLTIGQRTRRAIENLGPYQSLALLAVPTCIVEPLKLVAVAIAGEGHWLAGTAVITGAYVCSLFLVERLFRVVKPKLLQLGWFARLWSWFIDIRETLGRLVHRIGG